MGKEFVVAFVLSGANCAIIDLPGTEHVAVLAEARAEAVAYFGSLDRVPTLRSYVCDVTTESQVQATVAQIVLDFDGKIDVLVTAAGVVENVCVEKYPLERFKRVLDVCICMIYREGLRTRSPATLLFGERWKKKKKKMDRQKINWFLTSCFVLFFTISQPSRLI